MKFLTPQQLQFLLPLILLPFMVQGAQNDHEPLEKNADLGFNEILNSALNNAPELLEDEIRRQQANDFMHVSKSWIAGRPSLQFSYLDDKAFDNLGMNEIEYGVQLPLWRFGAKQTSENLGLAYQIQVEAWQAWFRMTVAGKVREVLAQLAEAETMLAYEITATDTTENLLNITNSLFDTGNLARLDVMQIQSLLLVQKKNELQAEAAIVDAEREYEILTGLKIRPDYHYQETLTSEEDISSFHPNLRYLQANITLQEIYIRQVEINAKGNPLLTFGGRRERGNQQQEYNESIGVSLSIPFGGKAIVASETSLARRTKVDAEVLYQNSWRTLNLDLHEVEHELFLVNEELILSTELAKLSQQRWEMSDLAFTQGEIVLTAVITALKEFQASQKEKQRLILKQQRLITEFNQTIGILP